MRKTNFFVTAIVVTLFFVMTLVYMSLTGDVRGHFEAQTDLPLESQIAAVSITEPVTPAATPTATPSPAPTSIPVYVPEFENIQQHYWIDTMTTTLDGFTVTENASGYTMDWILDAGADYYVLCTSDNGAEYIPFQIISPSVYQWEYMEKNVAGFMILAYRDNGQEGMEDDEMLKAYRSVMLTPLSSPTPTPTKDPNATTTPTPTPTPKPPSKYMIIVDKEDCAFAVFEMDDAGEYTIEVATYPAALGGSKTPLTTEKRQFTIGTKLEWRTWTGFSPDRYSPYASQYSSGIFFHGPIYRKKSLDTLMKYSYEDIGLNYKTGGCVRTTVAGARFVYYACPAGTVVEVVSSSDRVTYPGKTPIDNDFPSWDPTDPQKPTPSPTPLPTLEPTPAA
jgi:hypothetical protein